MKIQWPNDRVYCCNCKWWRIVDRRIGTKMCQFITKYNYCIPERPRKIYLDGKESNKFGACGYYRKKLIKRLWEKFGKNYGGSMFHV